jgi:dTDP-4-amino-4,6-dideoxygalactose transaminase
MKSAQPESSTRRSSPEFSSSVQLSAPVPLLDLQRQYAQIRDEVLSAIERVCGSQNFILGAEVEAFEQEMAKYCGANFAVGCASGTDALWLSLLAAGIQPGDQVVTSPFSFFASASAIVRAEARPVFVDIDPATFNIDPAQVERLLESGARDKLRALLPVHLYGQCADMDRCKELAGRFGLTLIEDAAQAVGAGWGQSRAGAIGACAAFSFYPTKNLSAYGDAGLVTTNDAEMAAHMRRLRNHGSPRRYLHEEFGWNSRLDAMQGAVLRVKLKYIDEWNAARRMRAERYDRLLTKAGLVANALEPGNSAPIRRPFTSPPAHHVFHQYVVRAFRRDELREFLAARKIGTEVYYPIPLHLQPCFVYLGYREGDSPVAERAAKEVLALPMFPELTEQEQEWVVKSIADFYC